MTKFVTNRLNASAERYPDKIAFAGASRQMSYAELKNEAEKLGSVLAQKGIRKSPVCVYMNKKPECIASMMGVLYSGNFYTVLDTHMPEARIEKILEILDPKIIVTDEEHKEQAEALCVSACDRFVVVYENAQDSAVDENLLQKIADERKETDTMYVLFTSGSTGVPKGVVISHKAVSCYVDWVNQKFDIDEKMVLGNQAPLYFVMTTLDAYCTMDAGATCFFIPQQMFSFPVMLLNYLKENRINTLYWVPSALSFVANINALPEVHLDDLKLVLFGGEVMPVKQLNQWRKEYPDVTFVNLYGATEITDIITYYVVDRTLDNDESLPIGKTSEHMQTLILDDDDTPVPLGEPGELCGTGPSLADGYYKMPEKTSEVFVPNPLYKEGDPEDTRIIYHMGDIVKIDERGDMIYVGRKDFQIKHMGHRIELGEIETAVSSLEGIDMNCCVHDKKYDQIVLFYTGTLEEDEVNRLLTDLLPDYMVPTRFEKMQEMPLNLNGKIDRTKLKELV